MKEPNTKDTTPKERGQEVMKEEELRPLPEGWVWTTVGEITLPIEKVLPQQEPDKRFTYLDISSIDNKLHKIVDPKEYLGAEAPSRARQLVRANDVLFSTVRTYLENVALVPETHDGQIASTGFSVLRANEAVLSKLLFYYSLTTTFLEPLNELQRGTSYPAVRDGDVRIQPFPLPPLPEQERIVARLEELLSDLEAGVAALERVRAGVKRYKASVLKAACEGKLFGDEIADGELPEGWRRVTLSEITSQIKDADHKMPKPTDTDIPYVSTRDFIGDDDIDFENAKHISEEDYKALTRKIKPELGDILLSRYGTVGQIRKVKTNRPFQASYSIAIIKPLANEVLNDFLVILLRSEMGQQQMRDNIRASSQPDLGLESIRRFTVPIPPLEVQHRIVAEVERRLEAVRAVESAVEAGLRRAGRLRQSVLKSAFEGKL